MKNKPYQAIPYFVHFFRAQVLSLIIECKGKAVYL